MNSIITLREYLQKSPFKIPDYQRGYIWGKKRPGNESDSVSYMLETLKKRYSKSLETFLQGMTVCENGEETIIIDGQQRTTFLYLLLRSIGATERFDIKYDIRRKSDEELHKIDMYASESENDEFQDIYFFKKTVRLIRENLLNEQIIYDNKEDFREYLLDKVKFLYINIPDSEQAKQIFSMMNGNKALMKSEEVIKSEMLRLVSLSVKDNPVTKEDFAIEWELDSLRSRYAREWDKWLHWWNDEKVRTLFNINNSDSPTRLLLITFFSQNRNDSSQHLDDTDALTFRTFKDKILKNESVKDAKNVFDGLRRLQKRFEDTYNDSKESNKVGAILRLLGKASAWYFVKTYFTGNHIDTDIYYRCTIIGMTPREIEAMVKNGDKTVFTQKYTHFYDSINNINLYQEDKESAYRLLLMLNIDEDNKQNRESGRRFDFSIWPERSLEHIYPQSKFSADGISNGHSIGNMVLLYKNENSSFKDHDFNKKKEQYFNPDSILKKSRHLLHSICVFAEKSQWGETEITENKNSIVKCFDDIYNELKNNYYAK